MISLNDVLLAMSNIPVDDPIAEIWGRGLQGGGYTVIEYTGELPITLNANGEPLIDYRIYGNTEQAGTPTPENPIMPIGCGERVDITGLSEPLCGIDTYTDRLNLSTGILTRRIKKLVFTGEETWSATYWSRAFVWYTTASTTLPQPVSDVGICSHFKQCNGVNMSSGEFNISFTPSNNRIVIGFGKSGFETVDDFKSYLAAQYAAGTPVTVWYVLAEPEVSTISVPSGLTGTVEGYLIQDGTPTPETPIYPTANGAKQTDGTYAIPYGYKLPILSNSTVTNIYLGEVPTTRRIKKMVFTGEEIINGMTDANNGAKAVSYTYSSLGMDDTINNGRSMDAIPYPIYLSSHFKEKTSGYSSWFNINAGEIGANNLQPYALNRYLIFGTSEQTQADFKTYLAEQYANGTPVTIWYVLAEPETAVVNEPLMKIGDYSDTVDSSQTAVQIPTSKGTNIIDYDGTPKPSQMYIKYLGGKK